MQLPTPPVAKVEPVEITQLGHTRIDPYQWMKDPNWQAALLDPKQLDPEIRTHLEAERAYADAVLTQTTGDLKDQLFDELVGRLQPDESTVPSPSGPWEYYSRYRDGGQHPLVCRRPRNTEEEHILLDGDLRAAGLAFYQLAGATASPDHRYLLVAEDDSGNEDLTIRILDLDSGEWLADELTEVHGTGVWAGNDRVLYVVRDEAFRPRWVRVHMLGEPATADLTVYTEDEEGFFTSVSRSLSGDYVFIVGTDHDTSEVRFARTVDADLSFTLIAPRQKGVEYYASHHRDRFLIRTNLDAIDYKVVEAPISAPGPDNWSDFVPARDGVLVQGQISLADHYIRLEAENALPRIVVRDLRTGEEEALDFDEDAYSLGMQPGLEQDSTILRYTYSSPSTPTRTYDLDLATGEQVLRKEVIVPSGHDPSEYIVTRTQAASHDGELVPVTILRHKHTAVDGSAPALLYGYGAYGSSIPASFSPHRFSLVDRGFIYAIAHIRGGMEKGYAWYESGSQHDRPNTHHDFIAVADHLIAEG